MNRSKYKIPKRVVYIMFLLFPFVKADVDAASFYFGRIVAETVDNILVLWQFISLAISLGTLLWRISKYGKKAVRRFFVFECLLCISLGFSTLTYSSMSLYRVFRELLPGFVFLLVANNFSKKDVIYFIRAVYYDLTILMIINSLTMYFGKPWRINSGNAVYYLFGLDNYTFMITFCAFAAGVIYYIVTRNRISYGFLILFVAIDGAYFYTNAATAIVISLLCILYCALYKTKIVEFFDWKKLLLAIALIFFLIVGGDYVASRFEGLFDLLGKVSSYSGRTHIWMIGFSALKKRLLFGYGLDSGVMGHLMIANGLSWEVGHLHNIILEYLVKGGIIGFTIFSYMWIVEIVRHHKETLKDKTITSSIYLLFMFAFLMYMFDYRIADCTTWLFIVLLAEMKSIVESNGKLSETSSKTITMEQ